MNDLWTIAWGAGLRDGLNPCIFMTCAVFIYCPLSVIHKENDVIPAKAGIHNPSQIRWQRFIFALFYVLSILAFNFGPAQIFIFQKKFIFAAKILYFLLGVWALGMGILFFRDWILLRRGVLTKNSCHCEERSAAKPRSDLLGRWTFLITAVLAMVLAALATLWPANTYIMLLGNMAILKGQWQTVMPLVIGYIFISAWPLWFVWAFLSIKNLQPSLLKIICAAIFFTASSCVIFIFK